MSDSAGQPSLGLETDEGGDSDCAVLPTTLAPSRHDEYFLLSTTLHARSPLCLPSSVPHRCSTMFEMAFLQRQEFRTLHEPFGEPFYYGPERMSNRFTAENKPEEFERYKDLTFHKVGGWRCVEATVKGGASGPVLRCPCARGRGLVTHSLSPDLFHSHPLTGTTLPRPSQMWKEVTEGNVDGKRRTFVKDVSGNLQSTSLSITAGLPSDRSPPPSSPTPRAHPPIPPSPAQMAQYIVPPKSAANTTPSLPSSSKDGNPTVIPSELLLHPDVHHTFLVRTPEKAVPSECGHDPGSSPRLCDIHIVLTASTTALASNLRQATTSSASPPNRKSQVLSILSRKRLEFASQSESPRHSGIWLQTADLNERIRIHDPLLIILCSHRISVAIASESPSSHYRMLYDWLVSQGQKPIIIDAADLLANPIPVRDGCVGLFDWLMDVLFVETFES